MKLKTIKTGIILCSMVLILTSQILGQSLKSDQMDVLTQKQFLEAIEEYRSFLRLPNDGHYPEQTQMNMDWCLRNFAKKDFSTQTIISSGVPHVFAEKIYDPEKKSILFYMQIDGQPVDTSMWEQENPYEPVLKSFENEQWKAIDWNELDQSYDPDWRVFARSASDSKGPAICFLSALDIMIQNEIVPDFNIKVIMDFQEEMGSPTLPQLVLENKELLDAELLLIMDGTRHLSNLPTLTFGARGIATISLRVFGARRDLHSGQYGNFAPNPVFKMATLLAGMKDENGRVAIPGYYDGIELSETEKTMINDLPENLDDIKASLGIAEIDNVGETYQEALQYPSLNVRGLRAAWVGDEVRTLVPSEVVAELDLRLVPESDGMRQVELIRNFILENGYHIVEGDPTEEERNLYPKLISFNYRLGSKPFRTELDSPIGLWLGSAMDRTFGKGNYVKMRTTGGSQPIAPFIVSLDLPAVSIRIPNPDNSIHAPNENMRLGNFLEGLKMCLGVLTQEMN